MLNLTVTELRWCSATGKVTAGLTKSNGSLPSGGWLIVTCGLTACIPGSAPGPTLGNEYEKPLPFTFNDMVVVLSSVYFWLFMSITLSGGGLNSWWVIHFDCKADGEWWFLGHYIRFLRSTGCAVEELNTDIEGPKTEVRLAPLCPSF